MKLFSIPMLMAFAVMSACSTNAPKQQPVAQNEYGNQNQPTRGLASSAHCDVEGFIKASEKNGCNLSQRFKNRLGNHEFNYCKQYPGADYAVATEGQKGQVYIQNKRTCEHVTNVVDSSGIAEMVVSGGFMYMRSNDGQLYIVDATGKLFEIKSNAGHSYSRSRQSAVTDIAGGQGKIHITLENGQTFDLTPGEVQGNSNRFDLIQSNKYMD